MIAIHQKIFAAFHVAPNSSAEKRQWSQRQEKIAVATCSEGHAFPAASTP